MPKIIKTKPLKRRKAVLNEINPIIALLLSGLKGFIFIILTLLVESYYIFNGHDFSPVIMVILYLVIFLGGFISGVNAAKTVKGRGIVNGLWGGIVYICLLLLLNVSLLKFNVSVNIIYLIPLCLISGILGGIYNSNRK